MPLPNHPLRARLTNELHARPSLSFAAPAQVGFLVVKTAENAIDRPAPHDHDTLNTITQHYGLPKADPQANHYEGQLGNAVLKWEKHTEVATYTLLRPESGQPFDRSIFDLLPKSWADTSGQTLLTGALVDIHPWTDETEVEAHLNSHFARESLMASFVLDEAALIAGDFRMDGAGFLRFAVFVKPGTGVARVGRIVQRLCEIETYKALSMLGFAKAQSVAKPLVDLDSRLSALLAQIDHQDADATLASLLDISAEIETHASVVSFRFSASEAYETIVHQRIEALRETRFKGRQTLSEFMMRRYNPAMRTLQSTRHRLSRMTERASNAASLLRTRVDVARSAQSQELLESMDQRADAQLQLQKTVEGLSVVAIGYYAVSLSGYLLAPVIKAMGWDKSTTIAVAALPILFTVWWIIRSIRAKH